MTKENLIVWNRFTTIHMNVSGYAVGVFLERDDGKRRTIELMDITESDKVSALGVCKVLEESSKIEYMSRQEIVEEWVKTGGYEHNQPKGEWVQKVHERYEEYDPNEQYNLILVNPECNTKFSKFNQYIQKRCGMLDLGISINDNLLTFAPSLEKEVKRKISEVVSEVEIETNPYISVLLMAVGHLNRQSAFNTRNIGTFGGKVCVRPRTQDDPEYIPNHARRWAENEYAARQAPERRFQTRYIHVPTRYEPNEKQ
jgi:hypothetical protein